MKAILFVLVAVLLMGTVGCEKEDSNPIQAPTHLVIVPIWEESQRSWRISADWNDNSSNEDGFKVLWGNHLQYEYAEVSENTTQYVDHPFQDTSSVAIPPNHSFLTIPGNTVEFAVVAYRTVWIDGVEDAILSEPARAHVLFE